MDLTRKKRPRKRAFKACKLCRSRKAKCEFSSPEDVGVEPCLRCRKEGEQCLFLPTRRGGNYGNGYTAKRARELAEADGEDQEKQHGVQQASHVEHSGDDNAQVDIRQLAEAPLCNPSDALEILARTSPSRQSNNSEYGEVEDEDEVEDAAENPTSLPSETGESQDQDGETKSVEDQKSFSQINSTGTADDANGRQILETINNFLLVKLGLINPTQLRTYVSVFISRHNYYLPIIPTYRLPSNDHSLGQFVKEEPFLLMVMVLIVTRYEKDSTHVSCWKFVRCHLSGITYGGLPTVGVVEGLLLLSEHLPRLPNVADDILHRVEAFMSWNLIGLAVRFSYFLGLDQKTLLRPNQVLDEHASRERLAWTYCYVFDRQVSISLGKAFWSRGPGLCFQLQQQSNMDIILEAHNYFPTLASELPKVPVHDERSNCSIDEQNTGVSVGDNSSLVLAYVELTQILTNIHDTLYPSRDQTIALVHVGEYYRMLDEFTRTFSSFRITWKEQHCWKDFPLSETIWATFYYTKLYAYSFAFQAHVQRAIAKSKLRAREVDTNKALGSLIFPRGLTGCADAKFILEAIYSASELLKLCVYNLSPQGALTFLPSRFYSYFSYAAVFLMKVVLTEAVASDEAERIKHLVGKAINAIQSASSKADRQHLGVRSSRQLKNLFRILVVSTVAELSPTPSQVSLEGTVQDSADKPSSGEDFALWFDMLEAKPIPEPPSTTLPLNDTSWLPETYMQDLPALLSANIDADAWFSSF